MPAQPGEALTAVREARDLFDSEDDVGNVLACLHTGAYALARLDRGKDAATLLTAVRRIAARRGIDLDAADPIRAAGLAETVPTDVPDTGADESALATLLSAESPPNAKSRA
ncbi:hypothetical protein JIG36_19295 [Actinoplanes sp. LDG1-06]|uniref:Uncharacterized protein n=1 Tax=Paractinoplanes ovalisporus TaxID=2810368 RepID=A0ABS2AD37_9ACTN|nr:hypothetical protein [Actinoplanes ovalisporus]MBM2617705.1 hypothetical protein [Actinoplanes ovalisporus]